LLTSIQEIREMTKDELLTTVLLQRQNILDLEEFNGRSSSIIECMNRATADKALVIKNHYNQLSNLSQALFDLTTTNRQLKKRWNQCEIELKEALETRRDK